ncbi:MAG: nucleotidyltransferase domain-containing protein [Fimbriimonadales bacterium]
MSFEFSPKQRQGIEQLCEEFAVRKLLLFGSAVGDDYDVAKSDLDFVAEFSQSEDLSPE